MPSITDCRLVQKGLDWSFSKERLREYTLHWNVKTDGPMGPVSLYIGGLVATPDPIIDVWQPFTALGDSDLDAYCATLTGKMLDAKLYQITGKFATLERGRDAGEANLNPYLRPVRYRGAKLVRTRAVTSDNTGKPLTTSANEEYDEALEEEISYAVLVARRYVSSLDVWVSNLNTYLNSVNSTGYRGVGARKWWCMDIEISDQIFEDGLAFYEETWQLALNLDTWDEGLLDRGWKILEGTSPNQKQINATDADGKSLTAPVLLDGTGKKLGVNAQPVERKHRIKREVNWTGIPV